MLTVDQLRQMTPEQRGEYFIAMFCEELGIEREDMLYIAYDDGHLLDEWGLCFTFPNHLFGVYYPMRQRDKIIVEGIDGIEAAYDGNCDRAIEKAIEHIKIAKRVKQLEAELRALRGAYGLPNPILDELSSNMPSK